VSRRGRSVAGRVALVAMLLVTSWSVWSWGQDHKGAAQNKGSAPEGKTEQAAGGEKAGEGEGEGEGPAPFNFFTFGGETPPYIAMLINFAILAAGYYYLGRKPIAAGLQARRDSISKEIEDAQRIKREAEERAKVYQGKLATLEDELRTARQSLLQAGEAESERIVREAEAKAERMKKDAEFLVEQELKAIRGQLLRETVEAAVAAAEDLLKKRVTQADQERLAEEYLADLGGRPRTPTLAPRLSVPPPPNDSGTGSPS
jgi:F0F1-type ATP synthase membrane subunit b/b'